MYIIHAGACEILKNDGHGSSSRVAVIHKGDFFGEMSLLTGEKRTATVRVIEDSRFIFIDKPLFAEMISSKPEIASFLAEVLARRQQELQAHVGPSDLAIPEATRLTARIKAFFNIR